MKEDISTQKKLNKDFAIKQATKNRIKTERFERFGIFKIFALLIILCIAISILQQHTNPDAVPFTFTALLHSLENVPSISIPFINVNSIQLGDWGVFNFLRDFIKILIQIPNVAIFLVNGIMNLVSYVTYFVGLFFGV